MHPDHYNGASLLGLNGIVIKSHGRADRRALSNAILHAVAGDRTTVASSDLRTLYRRNTHTSANSLYVQ